MKLIHTSDWHVGQNFYRYDREDEHRHFFGQLCALVKRERPDAVVVSGDLYHTAVPSASAQKLLVDGVLALRKASPDTAIVIAAGNHDSGSRLEAYSELWRELGIHVVGGCRREPDGSFRPDRFVVDIAGKGVVIAVPYIHPSNYPSSSADMPRDERRREFFGSLMAEVAAAEVPVVMMAHLAVSGCDMTGHDETMIGGMLSENLADLGCGYDYFALGHIHKPQRLGTRAAYCGSPLPVSFAEDFPHYVNLVTIPQRGAEPVVEQIPLDCRRPVVTLPPQGATLEDALALLAEFPKDCDCYLRLLVDQPETLAADAEERARNLVKDKVCRFCEVALKPRENEKFESDPLLVQEIDDFDRLKPIEIAHHSFERIKGMPMNEELAEMMQQVIDSVAGGES